MNTSTTKLVVGQPAPDFTLCNSELQQWHLRDYHGKIIALLFYPQNETLVCTRQLCSVRDNWHKYLESGAEIVGVSPGTEEQHRSFAQHHELPLSLLADYERKITRIYGSHQWLPIWATRAVVVVDAKGIVRYQKIMLRAFRPTDEEVLTAIHLAQYDQLAEHRLSVLKSE